MAAALGSHGIAVLALIFYLISIPISASVCISCSPRRMASAAISTTTAARTAAILPRSSGRMSIGPQFAIWILHGDTPERCRNRLGHAHHQFGISREVGGSWLRAAKGLPHRNAQLLVLRETMSVDSAEAAGVYC
jgi:hypothetical protein